MPLKQPKELKVLSQSQASMAFIHHFTLTLASKLHLRRPTTRQGRNDDGAKFVNTPICTTYVEDKMSSQISISCQGFPDKVSEWAP